MPAAKGKRTINVVVPGEVVIALDQEASARGLSRSSLILEKLEAGDAHDTGSRITSRLDEHTRRLATMEEALAQLVTSLQELVTTLQKSPAVAPKKAYPKPATLEETYPELVEMRKPVDQEALLPKKPSEPEPKGWRVWRR